MAIKVKDITGAAPIELRVRPRNRTGRLSLCLSAISKRKICRISWDPLWTRLRHRVRESLSIWMSPI